MLVLMRTPMQVARQEPVRDRTEPIMHRRTVGMLIIFLILGIGLLYAGLVTAIALAQTGMLFPVQMATAGRRSLPASAERMEVQTPDGERLVGVRLGATHPVSDAQPLLLGFGGNAWNADVMALYLSGLFPGVQVAAFHYRGYPPSTGHPDAAALLADALAVFDHLQRGRRQPVIAVGFSIGSGVAAYLARHRPLAGQILVTPFDSLEALAGDHFPWAPVGLLLRHRIDTIDYLRGSATPAALIAAERDTIVPARRSEPLRKAASHLVFERIVAGAGHNDLYDDPAFVEAMHEALGRIRAAERKAPSDHAP
jgi:pimeloyl-ACP methyl ester carboxylesterase